MKRLYLYLIKNFIGPFILTFLISLFVLLMQFVWNYLDDLIGKGLQISIILELITYALIGLVPLALPLAILLASIMCFGNMGESFELIAIKASGISLLKLMQPLLIITILISVVAFYMANEVVPITNNKFSTLLHSVKNQRPALLLKPGVFSNEIDEYSIKIGSRSAQNSTLYDVIIYNHSQNNGNSSVTRADSGYITMSEDKKHVNLKLYDGNSYNEVANDQSATAPFRREKFSKEDVIIGVKDFDLKRPNSSKFGNYYKMLSNRQIDTIVSKMEEKYQHHIHALSTKINYNKALNTSIKEKHSEKINTTTDKTKFKPFTQQFNQQSIRTKISILSSAQKTAHKNQRILLQSETPLNNELVWINKHWIEWHKRYTFAIACLVFFLIGAPLGSIIQKGGFGLPVVTSILIFISYYLFSIIGQKVAQEGVWKVGLVLWTPTYIYLSIGLIITNQAVTDSSLLNKETYIRHFKKLFLRNKEKASTEIQY